MKCGNFCVIKPGSGFRKAPDLVKIGKSNIVTVCSPSPNRKRVNIRFTLFIMLLRYI